MRKIIEFIKNCLHLIITLIMLPVIINMALIIKSKLKKKVSKNVRK